MGRWMMSGKSQRFACIIGKTRAFSSLQCNVPGMRPAFESIDHIRQARTAFGKVGSIDLRDIAKTDYFCSGTRSGDKSLHLFWSQVLGFVDDQELVQEGPASHEAQGLDLDT